MTHRRAAKVLGRTAIGALVASVALLGTAGPASADEDAYLKNLRTTYPFLSEGQLLRTGQSVCAATQSGTTGSDATNMVRENLGVSVSAAFNIVSAAVVNIC